MNRNISDEKLQGLRKKIYKKAPIQENNLICQLRKHVMCYCSCRHEDLCCGCGSTRQSASFAAHCLRCNKDLRSSVDKKGDFDMDAYEKRDTYLSEIGVEDAWS